MWLHRMGFENAGAATAAAETAETAGRGRQRRRRGRQTIFWRRRRKHDGLRKLGQQIDKREIRRDKAGGEAPGVSMGG